ncbi:hypothetical protein [Sulfitobacter aestuariivivens]|uniref:hypothetical protein n=1 Tax=Sulfitobacter aestuariivivens TaxID=2766981 RepID=UPI001FECFF78|nr:hypothetical protein [Sulfitobacter aestuariivivens]
MPRYEYKVVPAPTKGIKVKGVRGPEARFAHAIQELMNGLSGYGWEYQRAETLPSLERAGLTGTTTEWRNMLVFRRLRENEADAFQPELLPAPDNAQPATAEPDVPAETPTETRAEPPLKETGSASANTFAGDEAEAEKTPDNDAKDVDAADEGDVTFADKKKPQKNAETET